MADLNAQNRAVWFDIPVTDLERASRFYAEVLAISVQQETFGGKPFAVLEHSEGNGGCLIPHPPEEISDRGLILYLNAEGRLREAVKKTTENGGEILKDAHPIGPHGFIAIVLDSEGNRIALHSNQDA